MKVIISIFLTVALLVIVSCNSSNRESVDSQSLPENDIEAIAKDTTAKGAMLYVELSDPLEEELVARGAEIFDVRCASCHSLESEQLVAPGWQGITNRREPEWIMNMILNVNIMLEEDSVAHQLLTENQTVMPDQYLAVDDARAVLEFMRSNDLKKVGKKDQGRKQD